MPNLNISVKQSGKDGKVSIVEIKGFIDTTTATDVEKIIEELIKKQVYHIILDLGDVDFISSAGWGVFISEIRDIRENGGDLILVNMSPDVYDVYELMEFSSILKSFDSANEAIAQFEKPK